MQIFTSSWFTRLPPEILRVGISRGIPRGQPAGYRVYRRLAPGSYFNQVGVSEYRTRFYAQLKELDPATVVLELEAMGEGRDVALLCFESPKKDEDWCHRGFVSEWLHRTLGIEVTEHGDENGRFGAYHPKIPSKFRRFDREDIDVHKWLGATHVDEEGRTWTVVGQSPYQNDQVCVTSEQVAQPRYVGEGVLNARFSHKLL